MTVVYLGNIITGVDADTKPTNVQDKSIFYSTDVSKTYDFDLSTTTWTERGAGAVGLGDIITFG
jgi:hypothetical protein